jgi:hypothetical protein
MNRSLQYIGLLCLFTRSLQRSTCQRLLSQSHNFFATEYGTQSCTWESRGMGISKWPPPPSILPHHGYVGRLDLMKPHLCLVFPSFQDITNSIFAQNIGRPSTARSNLPRQSHASQQRPDIAPAIKPNKELKRLVWESTDRTWTRRQIDQERDDFFFTRVTGRPEVWQTIKTALEVTWAGGDAEEDDGGLKTAQVILNAASITLPHSTLDKGVYDVSGNFYALPKYIVCE